MEKVKPIKAFFGRTGGKHFSKKDILPFVKDLEYDTYIESFVGAGSIFLGRDKKVKTEIINDYDILVYNLWDGMKDSGNQLKDYKSYFMDKSVFKWYLLKEKQNRRIKKQLLRNKEINIENLKEDLYITKRSNPQNDNNSPIKHNEKNLCRCLLSKVLIEHKIENLKEDLYFYKNKEYGSHYTTYDTFKPYKLRNKYCDCINIKNNKLINNNKNKELKIENLKEDLLVYKYKEISSHSTTDRPWKKKLNECFCCNNPEPETVKIETIEIIEEKADEDNKNKELKIENLKEDIFINKNGRFSDNGSDKPNQKLLNEGCSHLREKQLETKIEEKADEDVCCSIEKTDKGLKLIKRKFYVRNKKYKGDETKWRIHNPNLCGWNNILANCDRYYERLKDVNIFQGDYKKMLKFDSPTSLFYFDPPWTKTATGKKGNKCYSNYVELDDFYDSIKDLKGFVMISYNNDKEILEKFKKWYIVEISTTYTQKKAGKKKTIDILIMNFKDGKKI